MMLTNNNSKVPRSTKNINVEIQEVKFCRRDQCEWANGIYGHKWVIALLPPVTKLGQGYIFTGMCDSVHGGGVAWSGGCLAWGCMVLGGVCLVPGGCLVWGSAWSWGVVPGLEGGLVETPPRWLLLWVVCILLECILVEYILFLP